MQQFQSDEDIHLEMLQEPMRKGHEYNGEMYVNTETPLAALLHGRDETNEHALPDGSKYNWKTTERLIQSASIRLISQKYKIQIDGGANRSVTPDADQLLHYRNIATYSIGTASNGATIQCTGMGYLPWRSPDGTTILIKCYHSEDAPETIISPTDIVLNHMTRFHVWIQYSDLESKKGYIEFVNKATGARLRFPCITTNGLWYYNMNDVHDLPSLVDHNTNSTVPLIQRLNKEGLYELLHARLGHPGEKTMGIIHNHVKGLQKVVKPPLHKCHTCLLMKMSKRSTTNNQIRQSHGPASADTFTTAAENVAPGQRFHMDMGFVRGTSFSYRDEENRLITSLDGYNSYLLIVDSATRYQWVFLTKTKQPQINLLKTFLLTHGTKDTGLKFIRTDQGGELFGSHDFHKLAEETGYILESTAADSSFQNGVAECPNKTMGNMMRCLLHSAGLGPEYWSWALKHATYLKNRLPHRTTGKTPYEGYTGQQPNLSHLRLFGCPVVARTPGKRAAKLDTNAVIGVFLGYTATDHNIYFEDNVTKKIKVATHVAFDEAGYTKPKSSLTKTQQTLQALHNGGSNEDLSTTVDSPANYSKNQHQAKVLKVQLLSSNATLPRRATSQAAGYDLYSAVTREIQPGKLAIIETDIAIEPPEHTYCEIKSRSGLVTKHQIEVKAGTIDRDYRGNVKVVLKNDSDKTFAVNVGDRIAQMVILQNESPAVASVKELDKTARGHNGFGSTGIIDKRTTPKQTMARTALMKAPIHHITTKIIEQDGIKPYQIWLSTDPFHKRTTVQVPLKGNHPTLGIITETTSHRNRIRVIDMVKSTPGSRIHKWRSTLKRAILISADNTNITNDKEFQEAVTAARNKGLPQITLVLATLQYHNIHPTEGSLQLHYDQLNIIGQHLSEITKTKSHVRTTMAIDQKGDQTNQGDLGKAFKLRELKKREDWPLWQKAQYKMLDSYREQGMFGDPTEAPQGANIHHMLWRYNLKLCGTRKARMVMDGSARQGTITLDHTFANSVDASSERLFWAVVAQKGLLAYGADCSNAFAEAPPPKVPLYMYIDDHYRKWWTDHLGLPPIPIEKTVVRVQNAIQGHPESPRLWEKLIDKILRQIGLKPTTHEPCLYNGLIDGNYTLFLRQVDDFAIATVNEATANSLLTTINKHLKLPIKNMGLITRFNGMDIEQNRYYVKIHVKTYLNKMLQHHETVIDRGRTTNLPIPLSTDKEFLKALIHTEVPPMNAQERNELERKHGIKFRQVMGEIMFAMVKCRPDISPHAIFLSQNMNNPANIHFKALLMILQYLSDTTAAGIHYWRTTPIQDLPTGDIPITIADNYDITQTLGTNSSQLVGYVDSDWATNTKKRNSITGLILMYAGGAVGYKTKMQPVVALSSTEAEFVAACETGKMILFYRSLLEDIDMEQHAATILFEDNMGALMMANAQQPTRRTRHIESKHFALLDWVEMDLLTLHQISTHDNAADAMTKVLTRQLFYRHYDTYMGCRIPEHIRSNMGVYHQHLSQPSILSNTKHRSVAPTGAPCRTPGRPKDGGGTRPIRNNT